MNDLGRTIYGVDFSGARLAGEKIWLARAHTEEGGLMIEQLGRAAELPGASSERDEALRALVQTLADAPHAVAGLDFPFALAKQSLGDINYPQFLAASADFSDADAFKEAFSDARRQTDIESRTPFSPLNYRLYRQTFHGIRDVLRPLVEGGARVLPMMSADADKLWLVEICPASTLKKEKLYLSYKGKSDSQRTNREIILSEIKARFGVRTSAEMDEQMVADTEGDALDAVLAALGTLRALQNQQSLSPRNALEEIEGRVYY